MYIIGSLLVLNSFYRVLFKVIVQEVRFAPCYSTFQAVNRARTRCFNVRIPCLMTCWVVLLEQYYRAGISVNPPSHMTYTGWFDQ